MTATSTTGAESDSPFLHPSIPVRIGEHIEEKQGAAPPLPAGAGGGGSDSRIEKVRHRPATVFL